MMQAQAAAGAFVELTELIGRWNRAADRHDFDTCAALATEIDRRAAAIDPALLASDRQAQEFFGLRRTRTVEDMDGRCDIVARHFWRVILREAGAALEAENRRLRAAGLGGLDLQDVMPRD